MLFLERQGYLILLRILVFRLATHFLTKTIKVNIKDGRIQLFKPSSGRFPRRASGPPDSVA